MVQKRSPTLNVLGVPQWQKSTTRDQLTDTLRTSPQKSQLPRTDWRAAIDGKTSNRNHRYQSLWRRFLGSLLHFFRNRTTSLLATKEDDSSETSRASGVGVPSEGHCLEMLVQKTLL